MPSLPLRLPRPDLVARTYRALLRLFGMASDRYHPEKHYMRGHGPKSGRSDQRVKNS
jgi:hypothetical protein